MTGGSGLQTSDELFDHGSQFLRRGSKNQGGVGSRRFATVYSGADPDHGRQLGHQRVDLCAAAAVCRHGQSPAGGLDLRQPFQVGGGADLFLLTAAVFSVVQLIEGYYLTPKIMGDRTGLNPLVIIVAIFFWGSALGGILGMILAIPLTAFLVVLWRLAREEYIGQLF